MQTQDFRQTSMGEHTLTDIVEHKANICCWLYLGCLFSHSDNRRVADPVKQVETVKTKTTVVQVVNVFISDVKSFSIGCVLLLNQHQVVGSGTAVLGSSWIQASEWKRGVLPNRPALPSCFYFWKLSLI